MNFVKLLAITAIAVALTGCGDSKPPKSAELPTPKVTASSQLDKFGPEGLVSATQPGWHSQNPRKFPEWFMVDFQSPREVPLLGLLPQDGQSARAPKAIRVEMSNDGNSWSEAASSDNACTPNAPEGWVNITFPKPVTTRYLKIVILSNCGDPNLVTVRGLRFK
jgi:hypothetical protein